MTQTQTQTRESDLATLEAWRLILAREAELLALERHAYWQAECIALAEQIGAES
jgi:hypothetical protein